MPPAYLNPTTSKNNVTPSWYGPILSRNTYLGLPLAALDPNAQPNINTPGPIFPSPSSYRDVITSSLNMLFGTRVGERLWLPTFGLSLDTMVFELMDQQTMQSAQNGIRAGIAQWEPRVNVLQVGISSDPNNNAVAIQVVLQLAGAPPEDVWTYSTSYTPSA